MNNASSPILLFPVTGFVAGLCSGLSAGLPPLGVIVPGIIFGVAISHAVHTSITPVPLRTRATIVATSTAAYLIAMVALLLSMRLPRFDNGLASGACLGAIAGGSGAFVVAVGLVLAVEELRSFATVIAVSFVGAAFGSLFIIVGAYISDHTAVGHPLDDIVSFPLWQTGVASAIPLFRSRPPI